jgi:CheY-like chemotaxis protein
MDGEAGLAAAAANRPDLILMDIQLPGIDGYEATRRLKANTLLHAIPIIAVTSYALDGEAETARPQAAMPTFPSLTARVSSWRRSASTCPRPTSTR